MGTAGDFQTVLPSRKDESYCHSPTVCLQVAATLVNRGLGLEQTQGVHWCSLPPEWTHDLRLSARGQVSEGAALSWSQTTKTRLHRSPHCKEEQVGKETMKLGVLFIALKDGGFICLPKRKCIPNQLLI